MDINVIVVYVQHSELLTDPLTGRSTDTAQYRYNTECKNLGKTKADWALTPSATPSLTAYSELLFGGQHTLKIHHIGVANNREG